MPTKINRPPRFSSDPGESQTPVARWRINRGISQQELAKRSGLTRAAVNRIEKGHTSPRSLTLARIARALEVTVSQLRDGPPEYSQQISAYIPPFQSNKPPDYDFIVGKNSRSNKSIPKISVVREDVRQVVGSRVETPTTRKRESLIVGIIGQLLAMDAENLSSIYDYIESLHH